MKITSWKQSLRYKVSKCSPCGTYGGFIDPGVNLFVLLLEKLGADTHYSCEGHPGGFYVLFAAPLSLAQKIVGCGYFTVELERGDTKIPRWSIRAEFEDESLKERVLALAAGKWLEQFGPLLVTKHETEIRLAPTKAKARTHK
jgi:hypothetical protein